MATFGLSLAVLLASWVTVPAEEIRYPYLAKTINLMAAEDQEVRNALISGEPGAMPSQEQLQRMMELDRKNTARMKELVAKFGWPTPEMIGKEAASNAWLLVQHADQDPAFQKECLRLMEPLLKSGQVSTRNYAYLFDRVRVNARQLQRYGTQGKMEKGLIFLQPVEDPRKLDQWRKEMNLEPIEEYLQMMADAYKCKVAPDWRERLNEKRR